MTSDDFVMKNCFISNAIRGFTTINVYCDSIRMMMEAIKKVRIKLQQANELSHIKVREEQM